MLAPNWSALRLRTRYHCWISHGVQSRCVPQAAALRVSSRRKSCRLFQSVSSFFRSFPHLPEIATPFILVLIVLRYKFVFDDFEPLNILLLSEDELLHLGTDLVLTSCGHQVVLLGSSERSQKSTVRAALGEAS